MFQTGDVLQKILQDKENIGYYIPVQNNMYSVNTEKKEFYK